MVDNITLKCCDKEVYHHLCYGTFVEESNWISGKPYDRLLLNNGKSGTDRENLKIEFVVFGSGTTARLRWMI